MIAPSPPGRRIRAVQHPGLTLPGEQAVRPGLVASATTAAGPWRDLLKRPILMPALPIKEKRVHRLQVVLLFLLIDDDFSASYNFTVSNLSQG